MDDIPPLDDDGAIVPTEPLTAILDRLRFALVDIGEGLPLSKLTPTQRGELWALARDIEAVEKLARTQRTMLDNRFRAYAADTGAKQVPTDDGWIAVEQAAAEYRVDIEALKAELLELRSHGLIAQDEIDRALTTVIEVRPDNRVLNFLAANRGVEVREAIERHRTKVAADPFRAKLTLKRKL